MIKKFEAGRNNRDEPGFKEIKMTNRLSKGAVCQPTAANPL